MLITKDTTDVSIELYIVSATDGTPATGLAYNSSGIDLKYRRDGAAVTSITEATLAALTTAHTDGGFLEIGNGLYRLDLPDAACATGVNKVVVFGTITGYVVMPKEIQLVAFNIQDSVRLGLTALPNAAADGAGGLPISDAGGLDLDAKLANTNEVTAARMGALTDWINGGRLDLILDDILLDTAEIGAAGVGLTAVALADATSDAVIADAVWNAATATYGAAGSYGLLIETNLDAAISSRMATYTQPTGFLAATFPGTVASTTNITAGTIATVSGNVNGSVGSVTGNVGGIAGTITTLDALDTAQDTQHATTLSKLLKYFQLLFRKDAAIATDNATEVTAINANGGSGGGTFSNQTDAVEAIRDRGDAAWITATGFSTLDAAGVRTAVGLASANLDTQLADLPTVAEFEARTLVAASYGTAANQATIASYIDTEIGTLTTNVAAVKSDTAAILLDTGTDGVVVASHTTAAKAELQQEATDALNAYDPPTNTEMVAAFTEIKGATWATTDTLEAIRDRGDAAWITATGFSTLSAADVRTAIGLASANLDTQLAAIVADTNELQTDWANGGRLDLILDATATATALASLVTTVGAAGAGLTEAGGTGDHLTAVPTMATAMTESYAADGATMTPAQALYSIHQNLTEFAIAGTTLTVKKINKSTTAETYTLDDATSPTSRTRAT